MVALAFIKNAIQTEAISLSQSRLDEPLLLPVKNSLAATEERRNHVAPTLATIANPTTRSSCVYICPRRSLFRLFDLDADLRVGRAKLVENRFKSSPDVNSCVVDSKLDVKHLVASDVRNAHHAIAERCVE